MRYASRGPIFLHYVDCTGNEERLIDCEHNGFSVHGCDRSGDAGVYCYPRGIYLTTHTNYGLFVLNLGLP